MRSSGEYSTANLRRAPPPKELGKESETDNLMTKKVLSLEKFERESYKTQETDLLNLVNTPFLHLNLLSTFLTVSGT
jgi:hypothetical protein